MYSYKLESGNILEIFPDTNAESPDEFFPDDNIFLLYEHRDFTVEKDTHTARKVFDYLEDCHAQVDNKEYDDYYIFPVDAYIHSGVRLSLANTENYPDRRWDVSTTGYVLVKKEYTKHLSTENCNKDNDECRAKIVAEGLIETWNHYLSGEVWGYTLYEEIDITSTVTEQVINQFKLTKYFTKKSLQFSATVIKDILSKTLPTPTIKKEIESVFGFYGKLEEVLEDILNHLEDKLKK